MSHIFQSTQGIRGWGSPLLVVLGALIVCSSSATRARGAESDSAAGGPGTDSVQKGPGFSIESEMLTYRALESNSEAVGCEVAAYLRGGTIDFSDRTLGCQVKGASRNGRVVIAPFDSTAFADFGIWRAEMSILRDLRHRADGLCHEEGAQGAGSEGSRSLAKSLKSAASAMAPAGSAILSLAEGLLGIAKPAGGSSTPVVGTIQDQAFLDAVARELRRLGIRVIMPSAYAPYQLASPAAKESPFLSGLSQLLDRRSCLTDEMFDQRHGNQQQDLREAIAEIDAYVGALRGFGVAAMAAPEGQSSVGRDHGEQSASAADKAVSVAPVAAGGPPVLLIAVLAGDGLAHALGADQNGVLAVDDTSPHILFVKALESGGTLASAAGVFKSKSSFSGGSVGTYALFALNGEVECSGNVYQYGAAPGAASFEQELHDYNPSPSSQFIFQRGGCQRPPTQ
ncbi:MAG TPA: hypothetical protein VMU40_04185 [Steroidobacteraceae bacterium]|nr:hypothetical protein [Steroidobacteraceae bacterium]